MNGNSLNNNILEINKAQIKTAWWNCSFKNLSVEQYGIFLNVIAYLVDEECDIIGLCEIDDRKKDDIKNILSVFEKDFEISIFSEKASPRSEFDFCLLVRRNHFFIKGVEALTYSKLNNTIKCGVKYFLGNIRQDSFYRDVYVFLSHWPSRMYEGSGEAREFAATKLQMEIEDIIVRKKDSQIIVMGDFNDEPYNNSLYKKLFSTRDKYLARKYPALLYNPFWAAMKSHHELNQSGTYYYASGKHDKWNTFDQILLSSSWLNDGWAVENEDELVVLKEDILWLVTNNKCKIDHLPVWIKLGKDNHE